MWLTVVGRRSAGATVGRLATGGDRWRSFIDAGLTPGCRSDGPNVAIVFVGYGDDWLLTSHDDLAATGRSLFFKVSYAYQR